MNYGKRRALSTPSTGSATPIYEPDDGDEGSTSTARRKSRNYNEKKRRDQFNLLINELCSMVSTNRKLDKTSVLKSAISFLRSHNEIVKQNQANEIKEDWKPSFLTNDEFSQLMLEASDGFLLVVTLRGQILFVSEGVISLLNYLQSDLVNNFLYDFLHPNDRLKVFNALSNHQIAKQPCHLADFKEEENQLSFTCHFRHGYSQTGRSSYYHQVECNGSFTKWNNEAICLHDESLRSDGTSEPEMCFCCTVRLQSFKVMREISSSGDSANEFTSRHSMEWNILFLDHRGPPIIGYLPFEVLGTSGYDYYHPDDLESVSQSHKHLMQTGKSVSCYYRFLTKGQQWIWLQTKLYITYHQWNSKPEFIVATNTVVSHVDIIEHLKMKREMQNIEIEPELIEASPIEQHQTEALKQGGRIISDNSGTLSATSHGEVEKNRANVDQHIASPIPSEGSLNGSLKSESNTGSKTIGNQCLDAPVQGNDCEGLGNAQTQLQIQLQQKLVRLQETIAKQQAELQQIHHQLMLINGAAPTSACNSESGLITQPILTRVHEQASLSSLTSSIANPTTMLLGVPSVTPLPANLIPTIPSITQTGDLNLGQHSLDPSSQLALQSQASIEEQQQLNVQLLQIPGVSLDSIQQSDIQQAPIIVQPPASFSEQKPLLQQRTIEEQQLSGKLQADQVCRNSAPNIQHSTAPHVSMQTSSLHHQVPPGVHHYPIIQQPHHLNLQHQQQFPSSVSQELSPIRTLCHTSLPEQSLNEHANSDSTFYQQSKLPSSKSS